MGIVKPHFTYPNNAAQHAADLEFLQSSPDLQPWMANRPIDYIRVNGASDEGPSHVTCLLLAWLTIFKSSHSLLVVFPHYLSDQKAKLQTTSVVSILSWLKHS